MTFATQLNENCSPTGITFSAYIYKLYSKDCLIKLYVLLDLFARSFS